MAVKSFTPTTIDVPTTKLSAMGLRASMKIDGVPAHKNPAFTGRDSELNETHTALTPVTSRDEAAQGSTTNPACCILHGLGGIGKSQIALEYTYRYCDEHDALFWLVGEQAFQLSNQFAQNGSENRGSRRGFQEGPWRNPESSKDHSSSLPTGYSTQVQAHQAAGG